MHSREVIFSPKHLGKTVSMPGNVWASEETQCLRDCRVSKPLPDPHSSIALKRLHDATGQTLKQSSSICNCPFAPLYAQPSVIWHITVSYSKRLTTEDGPPITEHKH